MGWDDISNEFPETPVITKNGGSTNYSSSLVTAPKAGITIAATASQLNLFLYSALKELMRDLLIEKGIVEEGTLPNLPLEMKSETSDNPYSGTYYGQDGLFGVLGTQKIRFKSNQLIHSLWSQGEWTELGRYTYREDGTYGYLNQQEKIYTAYSFKEVDGTNFLIKTTITPNYHYSVATATQLPTGSKNQSWEERTGKLWLRTNIQPSDYQAIACMTELETIPDVPGYVGFNDGPPIFKISDDNTAEGIPNLIGNLYSDMSFDGQLLNYCGQSFIPATEATQLKAGAITVDFDQPNKAQWYVTTKKMSINAEADYKDIRVLVVHPEKGVLFDNIGQTGPIEVPSGSYIMLTSIDKRSFNFIAN